MSRHKLTYDILCHGILCHDMSYVTTIAASLVATIEDAAFNQVNTVYTIDLLDANGTVLGTHVSHVYVLI